MLPGNFCDVFIVQSQGSGFFSTSILVVKTEFFSVILCTAKVEPQPGICIIYKLTKCTVLITGITGQITASMPVIFNIICNVKMSQKTE